MAKAISLENLQLYDKNRQAHLPTELKELEDNLVCVFEITTANTTITPQNLTGLTEINWGDGTIDAITTGTSYPHTYTETGTFVAVFKGVTDIGNSAFLGQGNLIELYIGDNIISLGYAAVRGCTQLKKVVFPDNLISIGALCFNDCTKLKQIYLGTKISSIGQMAFYGIYNIEKIVLKAVTPPTVGTLLFLTSETTPIYVPLESLNAYKTATNLVVYADRIRAIVDNEYVINKITALTGTGAPSSTTTADFIGQLYLDNTNNNTYQCTNKIEDTSTSPSTFTYTWSKMIRSTDYAGYMKPGVVEILGDSYGINYIYGSPIPGNSNALSVRCATNSEILDKQTSYKPIVPNNLDYAVKIGITTNNNVLSVTEQTNAQNWLGINLADDSDIDNLFN